MPGLAKEGVARIARLADVRRIVVMPDVHPGEGAVNGVAVATARTVYPALVGSDIGCGYTALCLGRRAVERVDDPRRRRQCFDALVEVTPILRWSGKDDIKLPRDAPAEGLSAGPLCRLAERDGRIEFKTLGRGNHFLELQREEGGDLWVMVHSGSRAMGPAIRRWHTRAMEEIAAKAGTLRNPGGVVGADIDSPEGAAYLRDASWAKEYATASRIGIVFEAMVRLGSVLGLDLFDYGEEEGDALIDSPHNFIQIEDVDGEPLVVHRKSVSPAEEGRRVIVPGSMAGPTFHGEGRGCAAALRSCAHGAGRVMSRTDARRKLSSKDLDRLARDVAFDVNATKRLLDESPGAYREVGEVMRAQKELVKMTRRLMPVAVVKGV